MILKNHILQRTGQKPILIDVFRLSTIEGQPVIIFCHGYKGYKDWGAWNIMAEHISRKGYCFVKFNFSYNGGTVEEPIDFPDLDAFGNNNYSQELSDLKGVIDWIEEQFSADKMIDTSKIILFGHSRGGGITLIKAQEDNRVKALISLASVSDYKSRFPKGRALEKWKEKGVYFVENGRTKQQMPHYFQFYTDFIEHEERLNIKMAAKNLSEPHLILHGEDDTSVMPKESQNIHEWSPNSKLVLIKNANHVFNTKQPWESRRMSKELLVVCEQILQFLKGNSI